MSWNRLRGLLYSNRFTSQKQQIYSITSRILQGKLSLNSSRVNLQAIIQAAIETVQLAAEAKSIDLQFTIGDIEIQENQNPKSKIQNPKWEVLGDATRLQQIIWNLLSNA